MAGYLPLKRELPHLHTSGAIKFRVVLSMARGQREVRLDCEARGLTRRPATRLERVRDDMDLVRRRVADMREFYSVANLPIHQYELVRVEHLGHVWFEARPVAAVPVAERRAA